MKKILAFSGSNSSKSINKELVKSTIALLPEYQFTLIDLNDFEVALYDLDQEEKSGIPEKINALHQLFLEHDGFLISCPEYNGFMPAAFKNVVDWISRVSRPIFQDKPMMLMATSPGARGGATNLKNIAEAFSFRGGKIGGTFSLPSFGDNFDIDKTVIVNEELKNQLMEQLKTFKALMSTS